MMGYDGNGWFGNMGGMGGFGMVLGLLFVVAVVVLLVWGAGALFNGRASAETPLQILKRRYAAGEISGAEFEQARKALA